MKGIPFRPEMVRSIITGTKTVTRRLSGLKEINQEPDRWEIEPAGDDIWYLAYHKNGDVLSIKPHYHPGETVYVKEAWAASVAYDWEKPRDIPADARIWYGYTVTTDMPTGNNIRGKWRSPLFLREVHARYFREIVSVRPGRLQEITEFDAYAEGIEPIGKGVGQLNHKYGMVRTLYACLWDSINKDFPWASNPWCFRIEFKRVPQPPMQTG